MPTMHTEDDLRALLRESADTTGDLADFRQRLAAKLAAPPADVDSELFDLTPNQPDELTARRRGRRTQWITGGLLAACIAAIALVVTLVPWHSSKEPAAILPTPDPSVQVSAELRTMLFPGALPLRNFAGAGSRRVDLGTLPTVPGHAYTMYGTCASGTIRIGGAGTDCTATNFGLGLQGTPRTLPVVVGQGVTWHLLLVLDPVAPTNGQLIGLEGPSPAAEADAAAAGTYGRLWHASGTGSATLTIPALGTKPAGVLLVLSCHGSNVHLSTSDGTIDDDHTDTCWAGYLYEWRHSSLKTPVTLNVRADPGTRWVVGLSHA